MYYHTMSENLALAKNDVAREYGLSVVKGTIAAIPFVGGAINEILFEARSRLKQERLNRLFQAVAEEVAQLGEDKLDQEFLASDEFSDLIEDICLRASRTASERKARCFRRVLVDAFQGKYDSNFGEMFMNILGEITEAELHVLSSLERAFGTKRGPLKDEDERAQRAGIDYDRGPWGLDGSVAKQVVQSLVGKALLADDTYRLYGGKGFSVVVPTELGERFLEWLGEANAHT